MEPADWVQRLAGYYHELLKGMRATATQYAFDFRQKRASKDYLDLSRLAESERLFFEAGRLRFLPPKEYVEEARPELLIEADESDEESAEEEQDTGRAYKQLLRLYQALQSNPYERELLYFYPLLLGNDSVKDIYAPLFTAPCRVQYEFGTRALSIELSTDEPHLNAALLGELVEEYQRQFLEDTIFASVPSLPFTPAAIRAFLGGLRDLLAFLHVPEEWDNALVPFPVVQSTPGRPRLQVVPCAGLILVPRSNYYLLRDLATLRDEAVDTTASVIARFWDTTDHVATDDGDDLTLEEDYVLPFVSNEQQRRVIRAAERSGVVVVSGPPGTGKSLTIANLVCHLVAQGQKVLVSSQKDKALEVVSEKLAELKTDYLFLMLLKDDAESKKILAGSIEALSSHIEGLSARGLLEAQKRLEEERAKERRLAGQVRADFDKLQAIEREYGSAYQRYADAEPFDLIPPEDYIEENAEPEAVEALRKAVELQLACVNEFGQLNAWYERANEIVDTEVVPVLCDSLRRVGQLGRSVLELLKNDHVRLVLDRLNRDTRFRPEMAESLRAAVPVVCHAFQQWLVKLLGLAAQDSDGHWCDVATRLSKGRPDDLDRFRVLLGEADSATREAFGLREFRDRFAASPSDVDELQVILDEFRETYRKPLRIFNPSFRRCRKRLLGGYPGLREKRAEDDAIEVIGKWIGYWKSRRVADSRCAALSPNLAGALNQLIDGDMAGWSAELALRTLVLDVADAESEARAANDRLACDLFALEEIHRLESLDDLSIVLADAEAALGIVSSVWETEGLLERTALQSLGGPLDRLMEAVNRLSPDDGVSCDALDRLAEALPHFCRLVQLLRGPLLFLPGFAASLTTEARITRQAPVVLANLQEVIEAYRLRNLISRLDSEFPRTTQELARAMRDRREALLNNSRKLLQVFVNRRLFEAYSKKSVAADIHYFRRTIRKGRRSYKRFEELKREFNFETLLTIFPCWIMGLEDVCRVFPLQPGLFDCVIIDEASQCHQPGGLPVLVRAKRAIIVGDEKQLPNADVTWLPDAVNQANYQRSGIHELPRSSLFDAKESSLLDLCTGFADLPPIFLNEHFRSYPEIIRFSNERIYAGRLRIATDSANNPYGRILNVVPVEGAEEDTTRRVNLKEAVRLADGLISLMEDPKYRDASFGVLSLFREQTAQVQRVLEEKLAGKPDLWERHRLIVATVDGFQGDERDIILYSFRYGLGSSRNILMPLQRSENRMNVAFTRARRQVFCYISRPIHEFPRGLGACLFNRVRV